MLSLECTVNLVISAYHCSVKLFHPLKFHKGLSHSLFWIDPYVVLGFIGWMRCKLISKLLHIFKFCCLQQIIMAVNLLFVGFFIPYFFLPEKVMQIQTDGGPDPKSFVLAVIGLSNTIGRVFAGWIADRPWANSILINNISLILAGIITILCPFCTSITLMILFAMGFGLFTGKFICPKIKSS